MGMNEENVDKTQGVYLQQTLHGLADMVAEAARSRDGSFSDRNPMLGKMVRCPHCHTRRRQNAQESCCNAKLSTTYWTKILEDGTREQRIRTEVKSMMPRRKGRKNPRLTRHIPPLFLMRQRLLELESDPATMPMRVALLQDAVEGQVHGKNSKWGHTPQKEIAPAHVAAFIEKVIIREFKLSVKRKRQMQKESRRINRSC
jgi:hypothetical protein